MANPDDRTWPSPSRSGDENDGDSYMGNNSSSRDTRIKPPSKELKEYSGAGNGSRSPYGSSGKVK